MKSLSLFIPIEPLPKERPRVNTRTHQAYTSTQTRKYENALKKAFGKAWGDKPPLKGPVFVESWFYITRPKSAPKKRLYPETKPDLDNFLKSSLDATDFTYSDRNREINKSNKSRELDNQLERAIFGRVIENDSRIVSEITHKRYSDSNGGVAGVYVVIREVPPNISIINPRHGRKLSVIFNNPPTLAELQSVAGQLAIKEYFPIFLDIVETEDVVGCYTYQSLMESSSLCVVVNGDRSSNPRLDKTLECAEGYVEIFKLHIRK